MTYSKDDAVVLNLTDTYGVIVTVTKSAGLDNATLVIVDTKDEPDGSDGSDGLRVMVNDGDAYEGVPYRHDPVNDMDEAELARHNEAMENDPDYRAAMLHERN